MSFASESGYTPESIETILLSLMAGFNTQFGTAYTEETWVGSNAYKYFYALAQRAQRNEVKSSEIFLKLQQYIQITNERIARPSVTPQGLIDKLEAAGYVASVKKMIEAEAGELRVCVDKDVPGDDDWEATAGYPADQLAVNTLLKESNVAGVVTVGTEADTIVLSNGQPFDFKFNLPTRIPVHLKLTITLSENNMDVVKSPEEIKADLLANIAAKYRLGRNFEPQRYYTIADAPWAESVLLEWSDDNEANYYATVFEAEYDDLFAIDLALVHLVEV